MSHDTTSVSSSFFFFNDTATTEIYTLSLHDALPICPDTEHDSSATAITAAALLKLAAALKDAQRRKEIRAAAEGTVRVLVEGYLDTRGILDRGCYSKRNNVATRNELIWGSYYLFEALCVLTGKLDAAKI